MKYFIKCPNTGKIIQEMESTAPMTWGGDMEVYDGCIYAAFLLSSGWMTTNILMSVLRLLNTYK